MPISTYNQDGTVDVYNSKTGEVRRGVQPDTLATISPNLAAEYQAGQAPEKIVSRAAAQREANIVAQGLDPEVEKEVAKTTRATEAKQATADMQQKEQFQGVSTMMQKLKEQAQDVSIADKPGDILGLNSKVKQFNSTKKLAMQMLAKKIEGGRLSDKDREFYQNQIANITPYGLSDPKNKQVENLVENLGLASGVSPDELGIGKQEDQNGNAIVDFVKGMAKPFVETGKNVGEAVYQTGLTALPGSPTEFGSIEQKVRAGETVLPTSVFRSQEELNDPAKLALNQVLSSGSILLDAAVIKFGPNILGKVASKVPPPVTKITGKGVEAAKKALGGILGKGKAKYSDEILREGLKLAEQGKSTRSAAIKAAQEAGKKVEGNKIFSGINKWAKEAKATSTSSEAKQVDDLVTRAKSFYKGKSLNPNTAKTRWDTANEGFSTAGTAGKTTEAGYHRAIRDAIRIELDKVAPGFEAGTKAIKAGLDREKVLKTVRTGLERTDIKEGLKSPVVEFAKKTGSRAVGTAAALLLLNKLGIFNNQSGGQ